MNLFHSKPCRLGLLNENQRLIKYGNTCVCLADNTVVGWIPKAYETLDTFDIANDATNMN